MGREVFVDTEESFRAFVAARLLPLSRVAFMLTGDWHLAEDLVQNTLVRVARHWERVAAAGDPDHYVRRTMYNQHVSMWRRRWRAVELRSEVPDLPLPDPTTDSVRSLVVRQALARLAPRQRAVLVLRFYEDLTIAESAEVLGCSVSTVKSQVRDALARLQATAPELADLVGASNAEGGYR